MFKTGRVSHKEEEKKRKSDTLQNNLKSSDFKICKKTTKKGLNKLPKRRKLPVTPGKFLSICIEMKPSMGEWCI